ncbi:hypothetical protein ABZ912_10775 [Nonomuraea angiospora]
MEFEIREIRTPQGRRKPIREREEYFRLMEAVAEWCVQGRGELRRELT